MVLVSVNQEVVFTLRLYMDTVVITFIFFIAMFCIIGLYNVSVLNKIKLSSTKPHPFITDGWFLPNSGILFDSSLSLY